MATFGDGELLVDGPIAVTRMACPSDALASQDDALIALFNGQLAVGFDPLQVRLILSKGDTSAALAPEGNLGEGLPDLPLVHAGLELPAGMPPYLNPFGLSEDLRIHAQPDLGSNVVGIAFSGQVLRNRGCDAGWCQIEPLDGGKSGWAQQAHLEPSDSVLRAGQGVFDAVGPVPCAVGAGATMGACAMGVARDGGGTATVVVTKPDGFDRILFFTDGAFLGSDTSQAGGGFETSATRDGDLTTIRVDDDRYEIPDAVIFGG